MTCGVRSCVSEARLGASERSKRLTFSGVFVLAQEAVRRFESEADDAVEVVAPAENGHLAEFGLAPAGKVVLAAARKVVARDRDAVALAVKLEEDVAAPKDEQVRVLGDDGVDEAGALEVGELRVGFVGRDNVLRATGA